MPHSIVHIEPTRTGRWTVRCESDRDPRSEHRQRFALASALTAVAAFSDYVVVPKRFTPGFEYHLRIPQIAAVYVAFGAGLVAPFIVEDFCRRRRPTGGR